MSVDAKLLDILCCPVTKVPMTRLSKARLKRLNAEISAGNIKQADGGEVTGELSEALVTENGTAIYPVTDGIPVMLPENGIDTVQIEGFKHIR